MPEEPWSSRKSTIYSFLYRNPKSTKVTIGSASLLPEDDVLDIGCGPGAAVRLAAEQVMSAVGVDASKPMIDIAAQRSAHIPNATFQQSPAESLSFDADSFSVVWTIQSWHHWNNPLQAYAEILRVLKPKGRFMIVEKSTKGAHGILPGEAKKLATELAEAGFDNTTVETHGKFLVVSGIAPS